MKDRVRKPEWLKISIGANDGISDSVSNERILEIFNLEKTAEAAGKRLIDEAVASQYSDNATIMIIKLRR